MNNEELDAWYEEQKQQLLDQYVKRLEEKKSHKKVEEEFTNKIIKIHEKYEKLFEKHFKHKKTRESVNKFISFMNKISELYK